jgi:hypothetical protein
MTGKKPKSQKRREAWEIRQLLEAEDKLRHQGVKAVAAARQVGVDYKLLQKWKKTA